MANAFEFKNEIDFYGNGYSTRYIHDMSPKKRPIGIDIQKKVLMKALTNEYFTLSRKILFEDIEASNFTGPQLAVLVVDLMEAEWSDTLRNFKITMKDGL